MKPNNVKFTKSKNRYYCTKVKFNNTSNNNISSNTKFFKVSVLSQKSERLHTRVPSVLGF